MRRRRFKSGFWRIGPLLVELSPAKTAKQTGHTRTVATWKEKQTGKTVGYTLKDVERVADAVLSGKSTLFS